GDVIKYAIKFMFKATSNEAKYETAIAGLQLCLSTGAKKVCLRTDSQLVANQYRGDYKVRESALVEYLSKMKQLASQLQCFTVELVPRGENIHADALSGLASSTLQDLKRSVFVEVLPRRSTKTNGEYQGAENDRVLVERLNLIEEVREQAALRMQAYLGKVARHYNRLVKIRVLQVGDLVLRKAAAV
ncbi:hypothetical protein RDABS01_012611, partial [Bienertia sinuspersici]